VCVLRNASLAVLGDERAILQKFQGAYMKCMKLTRQGTQVQGPILQHEDIEEGQQRVSGGKGSRRVQRKVSKIGSEIS